ncbi:MAG: hypothetical protein OXG58_02670 [Gemmatimonadetes bacterium]|nr:hypothetical protein [Gemmatimonadota bacterium]MCY3943515.1 hypothetical protein [Gemmatimonadota bacterium]
MTVTHGVAHQNVNCKCHSDNHGLLLAHRAAASRRPPALLAPQWPPRDPVSAVTVARDRQIAQVAGAALPFAMAAQQRSALRTLLVLGSATALSGCDFDCACTSELRSSVVVRVRDAATGRLAATGVTGVSEHESGAVTEFAAHSDLTLHGEWFSELPGEHTISLWKPGYLPYFVDAHAEAGRCHVKAEMVEADIARDLQAAPESPISFIEGPDSTVGVWNSASAEVQIYRDTLEIKGLAETHDCTELRVVPFRSAARLHVQVEPSDVPLDDCVDWRRFEARFLLPSGATDLLVTNAYYFPAVLFNGKVRPSSWPSAWAVDRLSTRSRPGKASGLYGPANGPHDSPFA